MFEELYITKETESGHKKMDMTQKLLLAMKSAEAIKLLHNNNFIHVEIKSDNLMVKVIEDTLVVGAIDSISQ